MGAATGSHFQAALARQFVLFAHGLRPFFLLAALDGLINMSVWADSLGFKFQSLLSPGQTKSPDDAYCNIVTHVDRLAAANVTSLRL